MPIRNLTAPPQSPPAVPSGSVVLYMNRDAWSGESFTIDTKEYSPRQRHSLTGASINDRANRVAFNLPVGVVLTLVEHPAPQGEGGFSDLKEAGKPVDLIGTGETVGVDLTQCNFSNTASAFYWRPVAHDMGAVELFEEFDFKGSRTVVFLAEWPANKIKDMERWYIGDAVSSARWDTLRDTQSFTLFEHFEGKGNAFGNMTGYGSRKELANFNTVDFNDRASGFLWSDMVPKDEKIESFDITLSNSVVGGDSFVATTEGENRSSVAQPQTVSINKTQAQTVTVTVTNAHTTGSKVGISHTEKFGIAVEGVGTAEESTTYSFELSYSYTRTDTTSTSTTVTDSLTISQTFHAPPMRRYKGKLIAHMGTLPPTPFTTKARRWYEVELPGTTLDPSKGLYVRDETVTGTIQGKLCAKTVMEVEEFPL